MALFKCKMCGGDLMLTEGNPLATCEYCGTLQTVPRADDEKKLTLFSRANRLRAACEFDKAFGLYEAIVADFPEEAEAYWGLVLCKFGIEYVDDPATGKKVPTCHRSSFDSVMEDVNFEQTLENADPLARKVYREEAKQIEELRKDILAVSSKAEPYDIFICYKETDAKGERTLDSVLAQDVYDALTDKGYRVFFSRISLEDKLGQEYEPYIFAALNSAKVMLVFGTDYEYFNAVWVKNEWGRYLKLMEEQKNKHLIPCFKGIDVYDMPPEFTKLQAQDMGKVGAIQDLLRGIDKLITPVEVISVPTGASGNVTELLSMGNEALESKDWAVASSRFDLALVADPKCAEAYVGKLLAERKIAKKEDLGASNKSFEKSHYYREAMKYAGDALKQELEDAREQVDKWCKKRRILTWIVSLAFVVGMAASLAAYVLINIEYTAVLNAYYSGNMSAESTYETLTKWEWFKTPDLYTRYLLNKKIPGLYPEAAQPKEISIPDGVTIIPARAFYDCSSLTSVTIPDSVTSIGESAFLGCRALVDITLPNSVTEMDAFVFYGCSNLKTVYCEAETVPDGWHINWSRGLDAAEIIWGYKG